MVRHQLNASPKIRVFLADDELAVLRGLRLLLELEADLTVCGEATSEVEALQRILKLRPQVAVVDLRLKTGDGLGLIRQLHQKYPTLKILVFSMHDQVDFATTAFALGAHGYVVKEEGTETVVEAMRVILDGGCYLSTQIAAKAPGLFPRLRLPARLPT